MSDWVSQLDPNSHAYYYFSPSSGVTTWDRPTNYVPQCSDYEERWDEVNEAPYYYDKVQAVSQWEKPSCFGDLAASVRGVMAAPDAFKSKPKVRRSVDEGSTPCYPTCAECLATNPTCEEVSTFFTSASLGPKCYANNKCHRAVPPFI